MSPTGKENFQTLREAYRFADYRRFRAKHRSGRWGDFLGFGATGEMIVGWFDGDELEQHFEPDVRNWSQITIYY